MNTPLGKICDMCHEKIQPHEPTASFPLENRHYHITIGCYELSKRTIMILALKPIQKQRQARV